MKDLFRTRKNDIKELLDLLCTVLLFLAAPHVGAILGKLLQGLLSF